MQKKLTITMDETVYYALHEIVGRRNISSFLTDLARQHVLPKSLEAGYKDMAADKKREKEAQEWTDALIGDIGSGSC